jgi:hypothetical protein
MLACSGTVSSKDATLKEHQEPVSMSIIVNFTRGTVNFTAEPSLFNDPIKILDMNELALKSGAYEDGIYTQAEIVGTIDRVTGDVHARHDANERE